MASDLFTLEGKTALVTGGARGIGAMCAGALLDHGASVVITSRKREDGEAACEQLGQRGSCDLVVADLAKPDGVDEIRRALEERIDALHVLVNNAGVTWGAPFEEYPAQAWDRVLGLDVAVPFRVVQALLGMLESAARPGDPARVVNMGSVDGYAVGPFDNFAYPAAKAALHHLTRVLAFRLAGRGITANCIAAGPVQTKMTQGLLDSDDGGRLSANPLGRLVGPDDLAGALVFLTARSGAFVTGAVVPVDGGAGIATWGMRAE